MPLGSFVREFPGQCDCLSDDGCNIPVVMNEGIKIILLLYVRWQARSTNLLQHGCDIMGKLRPPDEKTGEENCHHTDDHPKDFAPALVGLRFHGATPIKG